MRDGGPAFPTQWHNDSDMNNSAPNGQTLPPGGIAYLDGMSMRQYYAAHAPDAPEWFTDPVLAPTQPPMFRAENAPDSESDARILSAWVRAGPRSPLPPTLQSQAALNWARAFKEFVRVNDEYALSTNARRYFAWRWLYADMMLRGGE